MSDIPTRRIYLGLILLLMSAVALAGKYRGSDEGMGFGHHGPMMEHMVAKLDLDDEQTAQFDALKAEFLESTGDLREKMQESREALAAHRDPDTYNEAEVASLAAQLGDLTEQATIQRMAYGNRFQSILNEEQREKLADMRSKFKERMMNKRQGKKGGKHHRRMGKPEAE